MAHTTLHQRAESLYEMGDKNGKLLAVLAADQSSPVSVLCISSRAGELVGDTKPIMDIFVEYYSEMCSPIPAYDETELAGLLSSLPIPALEADDRAWLDRDLTLHFPHTNPQALMGSRWSDIDRTLICLPVGYSPYITIALNMQCYHQLCWKHMWYSFPNLARIIQAAFL